MYSILGQLSEGELGASLSRNGVLALGALPVPEEAKHRWDWKLCKELVFLVGRMAKPELDFGSLSLRTKCLRGAEQKIVAGRCFLG